MAAMAMDMGTWDAAAADTITAGAEATTVAGIDRSST
jgi:hypothetical protein